MPTFKRVAEYVATGDVEGLARKRAWGRAASKHWRAANLEVARERDRERYRTNKPVRAAINRKAHLKRKYKLTPELYESMLAAQGGGCVLCHERPKTHRLHVDHDHATGRVRALLCTRCNTMLGTFERVGWAVICAYVADPQAVAA